MVACHPASPSVRTINLCGSLWAQELVSSSRDAGVCGYYGGRGAVRHADVVLAPYATVLAPDTRRALGLQLQGAVLVVDEAHNLVRHA